MVERYGYEEKPLYVRNNDVRSQFVRDYTRILHSCAFRRLKHKTQVFFNIGNDHVCTRMEHVFHVESVSSVIAKHLGLNEELTNAIAIGHDIGHAPFGHHGERIINKLAKEYTKQSFWHEKNGLRFVDSIELLEDDKATFRNLGLTYAVRDGIVSHCGEIDINGLSPRRRVTELESIRRKNQYNPATWEACVVKVADKIAYVGRDIEDATRLGFFTESQKRELLSIAREYDFHTTNTTAIMNGLIYDICENSSLERGISLSDQSFNHLKRIYSFSADSIYKHERLMPFEKYSELVIMEIFNVLFSQYTTDGERTIYKLKEQVECFPNLIRSFLRWLSAYCDTKLVESFPFKKNILCFDNKKVFGNLETKQMYAQAIIDYISGMTDRYAIEIFDDLITIQDQPKLFND